MEIKELIKLSKAAMKAEKNAPVAYSCNVEGNVVNFSSKELNDKLREEFNALCGYTKEKGINYYEYKRNQQTIFQIIAETIDEVLPPQVIEQYKEFADVQVVNQGDKAIFRLKVSELSRRRSKAFVTRVGLAGRYETFMLDGAEMEVQTGAIGSAARIGFEEFLDGRWEFSEFTSLMMDNLNEYIYVEVAKALAAMVDSFPAANVATVAGFDEATMDELLAIIDTYGKANIYCTQEFANKMIPSDQRMSSNMKDQLWNEGWLGDYKGHRVMIMNQSILWGTVDVNTKKVIDPSFAYLIPSGSEKPVKIVFEGQTQVHEIEYTDDWSRDIQVYTKVGIGTVAALGGVVWIGVYQNTELDMDTRH